MQHAGFHIANRIDPNFKIKTMLPFAKFNRSWEFLKWEAYGREFPSGRTHSSLTIASAILNRVIFFSLSFWSAVRELKKKKKMIKETVKRNPKHKKITMEHNSEFKFLNWFLGELRLNFLPHLQDHWSSFLSAFARTSSSFAKKRFPTCLRFTSAAPWLRLPALHRFPWQ